jgi:hypothetical protein
MKQYDMEELDFNELAALFTSVCVDKGLMGHESIIVGVYILGNDIDLANSDDLESAVLKKATQYGGYAGMPYIPNEFLDSEHDDFESSDDGLAWVCFDELSEVFKEMLELLIT